MSGQLQPRNRILASQGVPATAKPSHIQGNARLLALAPALAVCVTHDHARLAGSAPEHVRRCLPAVC